MSRTQAQLWYNRFKEDREDGDENIDAVNKMILYRGVADDVAISFGSCQAIFTDVLGMKREAA